MTTTPRLGAPELASGQATPETTTNEQLRYAEQGASKFIAKDKDLAAPPGSPADGDCYIVAGSPTGPWTGMATRLAFYLNTAWAFITPIEGTECYLQDENLTYQFNGSAWASGGGGLAAASATEQLTGTEAGKSSTPDSVAALWEQGSDVASAGTVSLGEGGYFNITGTTTITDIDFATDKAGRKAWVKFAGVLTLTHHATTLILPTGASITTAAGDTACFISEGSDAVRCVAYSRASGAALSGGGGYTGGVQSTPILAAAMTPRTTNGAASGSTESATNKIMLATLDFDQSTDEFAQFMFPMPKSWNESTMTAQFIWTCGVTGNVVWGIQAVAISDDDLIDAAFGTAQTVTDGVTATTDVMQSAFTSAMTIGGTPAEGDLVCFQVYRDADNGSDTAAGDAKLIGIRLNFTTNAADDS